ncbi:DNA polymerase III subunit beta family protein [Hoyosella subflava]|uniref:Transcriptional regulator, MerR family n=1 Tax=Hoyosella subflava (strain DSM 45089 / JCM 17490 / NBRC 109087 / DQS3-9A1) TaxID=443218 RepID=F6EK93_HOYSD|nr:MerR family transcriptional regulator [Hoyosella subflava]AEF42634.1 Transcriptional regulator, MerR family [Hoyosella subflava DQS3-9A1]
MQLPDLMPIGDFARRTGLTPSALRFYADSAVLLPAEIDPVSGYRYYHPDQLARADMLRQLREIAMPLPAVKAALEAGPDEVARMIDEHVAKVLGDAAAARRKAARLTAKLTDLPSLLIAVLKGPVLADAVEQVLTATASDTTMPVLGGLHLEASPEAVTLTATDRYRLSTRTLVPDESASNIWAATVDGDSLRVAAAEVRRCAMVRVEASTHGIWLRSSEREDQHCRLLSGQFPDYRAMLATLPEATTRATVSKDLLLRAMEESVHELITLDVTGSGLNFLTDDKQPSQSLPAAVTGAALRISFHLTTVYPAVSTAIGPEVMLDLRGPNQPITIRSADRGDLTTVAMPVKPDHDPDAI